MMVNERLKDPENGSCSAECPIMDVEVRGFGAAQVNGRQQINNAGRPR